MWIARSKIMGKDANGKDLTELGLYYYKPVKTKHSLHWRCAYNDMHSCYYYIDRKLFPEVTFSNSPIEVELKLKTK